MPTHIGGESNFHVVPQGILGNGGNTVFVHVAGNGVGENGAAFKVDIQFGAHKNIGNEACQKNGNRNQQKEFAFSNEIKLFLSHYFTPPYMVGLRKPLKREMPLSIKRDAPTPKIKLKITPINKV